MSGISSWLLSIAGVVILSVLTEFVLPEGQINKYVRVIFSFFILLTIILPLPAMFGKEFDFSNFFVDSGQVQEDYLYQLNLDKLTAVTDDLNSMVEADGLRRVQISINANIFAKNLEVRSIYVDLRDIEYTEKFGSKDITSAKMKILDHIGEFSLLKGVEVEFDE